MYDLHRKLLNLIIGRKYSGICRRGLPGCRKMLTGMNFNILLKDDVIVFTTLGPWWTPDVTVTRGTYPCSGLGSSEVGNTQLEPVVVYRSLLGSSVLPWALRPVQPQAYIGLRLAQWWVIQTYHVLVTSAGAGVITYNVQLLPVRPTGNGTRREREW